MQIQSFSAYSSIRQNNKPQFRSVYPVVYWLAETNGSYAPVVTEKLTRTLHGKLIRALNIGAQTLENKTDLLRMQTQTGEKTKSAIQTKLESCGLIKRIQKFIYALDKDYRTSCAGMIPSDIINSYGNSKKHTCVRAFYDNKGGLLNDGEFHPISYVLSGCDAMYLENELAKPIGYNPKGSAEFQQARTSYWIQGLHYVKKKAKHFCDKDNNPQELHVKVETVRTKTGKIKDYKIIDMRFFPSEGSSNPFVKTGIRKG